MKQAVENLEVRLLQEALEKSRYNQRKAAAMLGLTYPSSRNVAQIQARMSAKNVFNSGWGIDWRLVLLNSQREGLVPSVSF